MDDNRLISENADGITVTYTYDDLGRLTQKQTKNGDTVIKTDSYAFTASTVGTNGTSSQVASYNGLSYTYDDNANILSVSDGTNTTTYQYDSANQLVRENNQAQNFTKVWNYDNAGNILSRSEYAYTTGDLSTATETVTYQYTSSKWGDMLRVYDGQNLTYDASGNLTSDGKYTYTWAHGRQLARITAANGAQMLMTYGADGLRTGRVKTNSSGATAGTYTYVYDGGKLSQMTYGNYVVDITYDAAGTPLTMVINGQTTYHYVTNLQGDVIALTDDTGAEVITYSYDAWGKVVSRTGTYATLNPLLYRGYVYDWEIHLYYLQSRYYNPEWGRFINGDGLVSTGQGFIGNNMFAYCDNSAVNTYDPRGTCTKILWFTIDCGSVHCEQSKKYNPSPPRIAVIYDCRTSGEFFGLIDGEGFANQSATLIDRLMQEATVEEYPYSTMGEFVDAWNSLGEEYYHIYIVGHGYPGGLSCNDESIDARENVGNGKVKYGFDQLKTVSASQVNLYTCNGATAPNGGNSAASYFVRLTGGQVYAICGGTIHYRLITHTPYNKGGQWIMTIAK